MIDVVGSLLALSAINEKKAKELLTRYSYEQVFLFPPWREIYETDDERDHTFEHASNVYHMTRNWFRSIGQDYVEMPFDTPEKRATFILNHINAPEGLL